MNLKDLLLAVREKTLTKTQLEDYHTTLTALFGDIKDEQAEKEKGQAIFMYEKRDSGVSNEKNKWEWKASPEGQRLIELKALAGSVSKQLSSLKNRIYSRYD